MKLFSAFLAALLLASAPALAANTVIRSDCSTQANPQFYYLDYAENTTNAATYTNVTLDISDMPASPDRQIVVAIYCEQSGAPSYTGTADISELTTTKIAEDDDGGSYIGLYQANVPTGTSVDVDFSTSSGDCLRIGMNAWGLANVVATASNSETATSGTTLTTAATFTNQPGAVFILAGAQGQADSNPPYAEGTPTNQGGTIESNFTIFGGGTQIGVAISDSPAQAINFNNGDGSVLIAAAWEPSTPFFVCRQDAPAFDIEYQTTFFSTSDAASYAYTNIDRDDFTSAVPYRSAVIGVGGASTSGSPAVDFLAWTNIFKSLSELNSVTDGTNPGSLAGIYQSKTDWAIPRDDDLTLDLSSTWGNSFISIYMVTNALEATQAECSDNADATGDTSCTATIPDGGGAICHKAAWEVGAQRSFTWTGCTENFDFRVELTGGTVHSVATGCSTTTEEGSTTFTANASGDLDDTALQCQTFAPRFETKGWEK